MARAGGTWWRIDGGHPDHWDWAPFPTPRHRFDPASGRFRVRYAANRPGVATRERFPARLLTDADGELWLVQLDRMPAALHLTHQATLEVLDVDDRVSTGRLDVDRGSGLDPLLDICGQLADAVHDWWDGRPPPLVYRSRTTPGVGRNLAFTETTSPRVVSAGRLRDAVSLHAHLVLHARFIVPDRWLR